MTDKFKLLIKKNPKKISDPKFRILFFASVIVVVAGATAITFGISKNAALKSTTSQRKVAAKQMQVTEIKTEEQEVPVDFIALNKTSAELKVGDSLTLTAATFPKDAENTELSWKSNNTDVAAVDKGKVTAEKAGNCKITVTSDNDILATCSVTVKEKEQKKETPKKQPEVKKEKKAAPKASVQAPSKPGFKNSAFSNCSQVIAVVAPKMNSRNATVTAYQNVNGSWETAIPSVSALIGENGLAYDNVRRQETDTTPAGIYSIEFAFGSESNPGTKIQYRQSDDNSYWDENSGSKTYNRWVEGCPGGDYEQLKTEPLYKHALVLNFNWNQTPGKGCGIFIHDKPNFYTGGCIGINDGSLVSIMKWIDPSKNTKVLICPKSDLSKYYY